MQKLILVLLGLLFLNLSSCAHHRDVRPAEDGVHSVVVRDHSREAAERNAIAQANHFCKESGRMAVFSEEKTQYTGAMDEKTREAIKTASNAAWMLGKPGTQGGVMDDASTVGHVMTSGDDYLAQMKFKCQ